MAGGGGGSESGEPEFQIAPMIDVLLVLLIFFMSITTAEILKVDPSIVLPVSPNAKKAEAQEGKNELAINLRFDKKTGKAVICVDDKEYNDTSQLPPYLKLCKERNPKLRVVFRCDKDCPLIEVQRAGNLVGEGGIADIAYSALDK